MSMTPKKAVEIVGTLSSVKNPIDTMSEAIQVLLRYVEQVEYLRAGEFNSVGVFGDGSVRTAPDWRSFDHAELFQFGDVMFNLLAACAAKEERTDTTAPD